MSLWCPLLAEPNMEPSGKGETQSTEFRCDITKYEK